LPASSSFWVVGTKAAFRDGQGSLIEGAGPFQIPLVTQEAR